MKMTEEEVKDLLVKTNAIMNGHFLLTSGLHSPHYVEKFNVNATAKQQKETELQGLQQKIQQAYQDGQQELQKKSSELMQPIVAKVRTAIEAVGKAGNYTFIFEDGAAVYTGTNVVDVTKEVQAKIK